MKPQLYNCLEEYGNGEHVVIEFSEYEYRTYYEDMLIDLAKYQQSRRVCIIEALQRDTFAAGM